MARLEVAPGVSAGGVVLKLVVRRPLSVVSESSIGGIVGDGAVLMSSSTRSKLHPLLVLW